MGYPIFFCFLTNDNEKQYIDEDKEETYNYYTA